MNAPLFLFVLGSGVMVGGVIAQVIHEHGKPPPAEKRYIPSVGKVIPAPAKEPPTPTKESACNVRVCREADGSISITTANGRVQDTVLVRASAEGLPNGKSAACILDPGAGKLVPLTLRFYLWYQDATHNAHFDVQIP